MWIRSDREVPRREEQHDPKGGGDVRGENRPSGRTDESERLYGPTGVSTYGRSGTSPLCGYDPVVGMKSHWLKETGRLTVILT